jgi:ribosome-associated protein YbcJ (S4-like RNA binding protein)
MQMRIPDDELIEAVQVPVKLLDLLATFKLVDSKSEGKRLIVEGAITLDGQKVTDKDYVIRSIPLTGIKVMRARRRRICIQPHFQDDERWNRKSVDAHSSALFEIELVIKRISEEQLGD